MSDTKTNYAELAKAFIGEQFIRHYQSQTYVYNDRRYVLDKNLNHHVRNWLIDNCYPHNNHTVSNVVGSIQAITFIDDNKYPSMPFFIGENFPKNVIPYNNGLLNVDTGKLGPHSEHWVSTVCLPYDYNPEADCPEWINFLGEALEDDQQRIDLLQEWFGYCLLPDTSQHKLLCKVGPPRAGKGTTDRILEALIGSDNVTAYDVHSLSERFGLRRLVGKYIATIGEVNLQHSRDRYRILEKLNSIVGGDPQPIEHKGLNDTPTVTLPTRFVISCNELPYFGDPTGALTSRLLLLPFNKSFYGREDRGLVSRLLTEISGISNWSLQGLKKLKENKRFSISNDVEKRTNMFRRDNSSSFAFMQDCLVVHESLNPGNLDGVKMTTDKMSLTSDQLECAYNNWKREGNSGYEFNYMIKSLKALLPHLEDKRPRVNGVKTRTYIGIGVIPEGKPDIVS